MFCTHCGKENDYDAVYCIECGHEMIEASSKKINFKMPDIKIKNKKAVTAVAAVVLLVLVGSFVFGGRSYKKTIDMLVKYGNSELDVKLVFDKLIPSKVIDYALEDAGQSRSDYRKEVKKINEELQRNVEQIEDQYDVKWKNCKVTYEITDTETLKGDDLADIKELYKEDIGLKVSGAKQVEIEVTLHLDDDTEITNSKDIDLIKVGKSWYLDIATMGGIDGMF